MGIAAASSSAGSIISLLNVLLVVGSRRLTQVAAKEATLVALSAQDAMIILCTLTTHGMRSTDHVPDQLRLSGIRSIFLLQLVIELTEVEVARLASWRVRALVCLLE